MTEADRDEVAELERRWSVAPVGTSGSIHLIVRRLAAGVHDQPRAAVLSPESGVVGDRWAHRLFWATPSASLRGPAKPGLAAIRPIDAQVTLIERRVIDVLVDDPARRHLCGDNLVVDLDLSMTALPVGARLAAGEVILEITALPHAGCDVFRQRLGDAALRWVNAQERRERRARGAHARVLRGGILRVGDRLVRTI